MEMHDIVIWNYYQVKNRPKTIFKVIAKGNYNLIGLHNNAEVVYNIEDTPIESANIGHWSPVQTTIAYEELCKNTDLIIKDITNVNDDADSLYVEQLDMQIQIACAANDFIYIVTRNYSKECNHDESAYFRSIEKVIDYINNKWEQRCSVLMAAEAQVDTCLDIMFENMHNQFPTKEGHISPSLDERLRTVRGELLDILYQQTLENL
jgi:hypothetical protein